MSVEKYIVVTPRADALTADMQDEVNGHTNLRAIEVLKTRASTYNLNQAQVMERERKEDLVRRHKVLSRPTAA